MVDTVPIYVVEQRRGKKELAARNFGWPNHEEPAEMNQHFIEEMRRLKDKITVDDYDDDTKVAEMKIRRPDHQITEVNILV